MLFEIDDGYNIPTKRGFIIRPVLQDQLDSLSRVTADFNVVDRAYAFYMLAKKAIVVGRLPEADEDAVYDIIRAYPLRDQQEDERNLRNGIGLAMAHPHLAKTSCDQCKKWAYSPITGETLKDEHGNPLLRTKDEPLQCEVFEKALREMPTSGVMPPACPANHHTNQHRLSERNQKAFDHWKAVVAYGGFPTDDVWLKNATIIQMVVNAERRRARDRAFKGVDWNKGWIPLEKGYSKEFLEKKRHTVNYQLADGKMFTYDTNAGEWQTNG